MLPAASNTFHASGIDACSGMTQAWSARPTDRKSVSPVKAPIGPPETPTKPIIFPSNSSNPMRSRAFLSTPLKLP